MEQLTWMHVRNFILLRVISAVGALTLDARLSVLRCDENVASERVDGAEVFSMTDVITLRALVELQHARIRKVPLVTVVAEAPEL